MSEDRHAAQLTCAQFKSESQNVLSAQPLSALSESQRAHLATCESCMDIFIHGLLVSAPVLQIPADFAANLCAALPAQPLPSARTRRRLSGISVSLVALLAIICLASVAFALFPTGWFPPGLTGMFLGVIFTTEIVSLALWLDSHYPVG